MSRLGAHLGTGLATTSSDTPLRTLLAHAIQSTANDHPDCDLTDPLTPAATVAAVRVRRGFLDWLVLGDATVAWIDPTGRANSITDDRADHLDNAPIVTADVRRYDPKFVAKVRNQPGGFWVAAADPAAAQAALAGTVDTQEVAYVGLLTDGLTRLVDRYGWTWPRLFAEVDSAGARSLVTAVRQAEQSDPDPDRWRGKPNDDASAIIARVIDSR